MNAPAFDTSTLSWVKDEIDLALERAGEALARHAAQPDQASPLTEARSHLHQAGGALTIVGLAGITHFIETVEGCLDALAAGKQGNSVAIDAAAGAALAALRRYLDDLMAGHPDQPLRLYPAYRALAIAAGTAEPSPLALFFPDIMLRPPRREEITVLPAARLKALRLGFARGLTKWRSGEVRGLTEMRNALAILEQGLEQPIQRAPWWVALAWFDALIAQSAPAAEASLLDGLDRQFELLANQRPRLEEAPAELMRGLLYGVASAPPGGTHLECVRAAYRLADLIPSATAGVETRREACRAPLQTAMTEWEQFSQGSAIALMRFHDVALLLAASTRESGDAELVRLTTAIAEFAAWLRQQPERTSPAMAIELAGALVLVEDAIEQEGARNPTDETLFATEVTAELERLDTIRRTGTASDKPLAHQRWREHRIIAQVAGEIRINLDAAEAALDAFIQSAGSSGLPPTVRRQIHQVAGAFSLLDEKVAAALAVMLDTAVAHAGDGNTAEFSAIAQWLTVLQQFATSLTRSQPDHALLEGVLPATAAAADISSESAVPLEPTPDPGTGGVDELVAIFIEEAHEVLATLAGTQPVLATNPADREALTTIRRAFHTLKGSGRMVNLGELAEVAYAVEKLLNRRLDERHPADTELLTLIDEARTLFVQWVACLENGQPAPDAAALLQRCAASPLSEKVGTVGTGTPSATSATVQAPAPTAQITVGDHTLSATLYGLYIDEARSHVATLQQELSGTAGIPSRELIRAAHTLAGISAGTGFPVIQTLAHALENALVRHSLAHLPPDETGRMLLARAVGALAGMVGAIAERRMPTAEVALTDALKTWQPAAPAPVEKTPEASPLAERRQSRPADEVDPQLAALFLEEADEQLRQLDVDLRAWRTSPTQADIGRRMARLLHTFKGGARMCGAMGIGELAHSMETRIEQALAEGGASPAVLDGLDTSMGRANNLIEALRQPAAHVPAPTEPVKAKEAVMAVPVIPPPPSGEAGPAVLLRVRADLIDHLVNEAGEMAIARSRIEGSLKNFKGGLLDLAENIVRLRGQLREFELLAETSMQSHHGISEANRFDPLEFDRFTRLQELTRLMAESVSDVSTVQHILLRQTDAAGEALSVQSRQNRELSHTLLRARMVPFSTVAERLHRVVRQTAKELERQANLDIHGGDTPVDRSILERMLGPLEHLLRNAVAHGIEPAARRQAAGKPELGQIALTITPTDNDITLTLTDDGAGLNFTAIRQRAIERGLLDADAVADNASIAELIFRAGFSTADTVSEIAGRGVGLDVVRDEVAQLGGHVEVSANSGHGTRFEIILPLTLAVIPVMLIKSGEHRWAIPAGMIEEVRELGADEIIALRTAGSTRRGVRQYPWHTLAGLCNEPVAPPAETAWQILLKGGAGQIALEVESITQNQEVVVKPVGDQLAHVPGLTGATVLPDGSVALIVNPVALAQRSRAPAATRVSATATLKPAARTATVMVVDDSLTVRKITGRLLERAGYRVLTAKDGVDALEQLEKTVPDVMLADIEMPRMDGFELVRSLRGNSRLAALPVIMITSRTADKHRQVAAEIGVQHYLGKPFDEGELLSLIAGLISTA